MQREPKTLGFTFEEIDLKEAQTLVQAGDGKYSDLVIMLSQKLSELDRANVGLAAEQRKGFSFGLPGGKELEEKERKPLMYSLNFRFNRMGIGWTIRYSQNKKLFLCVPRKVKGQKVARPVAMPLISNGATKRNGGTRDRTDVIEFREKVIALSAEGMGATEIARRLNAKVGRVTAVQSKYVTGRK